MQVHVHHVGSSSPTTIDATDFSVDEVGNLYVQQGDTVVAQFAPTKWSAALKVGEPATTRT